MGLRVFVLVGLLLLASPLRAADDDDDDEAFDKAERTIRTLTSLDDRRAERRLARDLAPLLAHPSRRIRTLAMEYLKETLVDTKSVAGPLVEIMRRDSSTNLRQRAFTIVGDELTRLKIPHATTLIAEVDSVTKNPDIVAVLGDMLIHRKSVTVLPTLAEHLRSRHLAKWMLETSERELYAIRGEVLRTAVFRVIDDPESDAKDRSLALRCAVETAEAFPQKERDRLSPIAVQLAATARTGEGVRYALSWLRVTEPQSYRHRRVAAARLQDDDPAVSQEARRSMAGFTELTFGLESALRSLSTRRDHAEAAFAREQLARLQSLPRHDSPPSRALLDGTRVSSVAQRRLAALELVGLYADRPEAQSALAAMLAPSAIAEAERRHAALSPSQRALAMADEASLRNAIAEAILRDPEAPEALRRVVLDAVSAGRVNVPHLAPDCPAVLAGYYRSGGGVR